MVNIRHAPKVPLLAPPEHAVCRCVGVGVGRVWDRPKTQSTRFPQLPVLAVNVDREVGAI